MVQAAASTGAYLLKAALLCLGCVLLVAPSSSGARLHCLNLTVTTDTHWTNRPAPSKDEHIGSIARGFG